MKLIISVILFSCTLSAAEKKDEQKVSLSERQADYAEDWVWRFVPGMGWRKFTPLGDAYKEYKDFRRVTKHKYWGDD